MIRGRKLIRKMRKGRRKMYYITDLDLLKMTSNNESNVSELS